MEKVEAARWCSVRLEKFRQLFLGLPLHVLNAGASNSPALTLMGHDSDDRSQPAFRLRREAMIHAPIIAGHSRLMCSCSCSCSSNCCCRIALQPAAVACERITIHRSVDDHNWLWLWLQPDQHEANQYGGAIARTIVIVTVVVQETHIASETLLKDLGIAF